MSKKTNKKVGIQPSKPVVPQLNTQNTAEYFNLTEDGDVHVVIIGCGAVGGYAGLALCKTGIKSISLIDADVVESKNIQNQPYDIDKHVGVPKVQALSELMIRGGGIKPRTQEIMLTERKELVLPKLKPFVVLLAVDSVKARVNIVNILSKMPMCRFVVEAQMGVGGCEVNLLYPVDAIPEQWSKHMADLEVSVPSEVSGCGAPFATSHMGMLTGGLMVGRMFEELRPDSYVPQHTNIDVRGGSLLTNQFSEYED